MKALHKLDLRGKTDENWQDYHEEHIHIWNRKMKFLPIHKPFFSSNTMAGLKYMSWFRVFDKSYLLSVEVRSRQLCKKKPRWSPQQRRSRGGVVTSSFLAPTQKAPSMSTPHPDQFISLIPVHFTNLVFFHKYHTMHHRSTLYLHLQQVHFLGTSVPIILRPHADFDADANFKDVNACIDIDAIINADIDAHINANIFRFCDIV